MGRSGRAEIRVVLWGAVATLAFLMAGFRMAAGADAEAAALFASAAMPAEGAAAPIGSYARGCLAGAVALEETGAGWQVVHRARNRYWAHPATAAFIARLSARARAAGWPRLLIGDIAQPRGGPMSGGHRSHQTGLDVDIWLYVPPREPLDQATRESFAAPSLVRADGLGVNRRWRPEYATLIRLAAEDPSVARIFVNAAIKKRLCETTPREDREWLRKVRPWWGHRAHMHVRLDCPPGASSCVAQDPPPPGDGCGAALDWWFSDEALNPPPSATPRQALTLADLPPACRELVAR